MTGTPCDGASRPAIIDFHTHFIPPGFGVLRSGGESSHLASVLDAARHLFSNVDALLENAGRNGIDARVLSAPPGLLSADPLTAAQTRRINDELARVVSAHPGRLFGLATIDAFSGEDAAAEVHHAVEQLGLSGIVIDSARDERLIDADEAYPVLAAAAELGVPVLVHPVNLEPYSSRFARYGALGTRFSRAITNASALLALAESERLRALPRLRTVFTTHAVAAVAQFGLSGRGSHLLARAGEGERRHLYLDTVGLDPDFIRYVSGLVGADHVVAGSDWPIQTGSLDRGRLLAALEAALPTQEERALVAHGTAGALLQRLI